MRIKLVTIRDQNCIQDIVSSVRVPLLFMLNFRITLCSTGLGFTNAIQRITVWKEQRAGAKQDIVCNLKVLWTLSRMTHYFTCGKSKPEIPKG